MKKHGIGYGCMIYALGFGFGRPDASGASVQMEADGTVTVLSGCADMGQGSTEMIALITAEELGILPEDVTVLTADTAVTPDAGPSTASRQTYVTGQAVKQASSKVKESLQQAAAEILGVTEFEIDFRRRRVYFGGEETGHTVAEVAAYCHRNGRQLMGWGWHNITTPDVDPETNQGNAYAAYTFATQAAEVEVDTDTGEVTVLRIVAAHDVGKAINPLAVEGQIEGGVAMGIGYALMEKVVLESGRPVTRTFSEYLIPTVKDVPPIISLVVEEKEPSGPFGAKGVAEPATIPTAPAILNAIYDAVGIRITELPATPEMVRRLLRQKGY